MRSSIRPRFTPKILLYLLLDLIGMALFSSGALWLFRGLPLFLRDFPSTTAEALIALVGGLLLMVVAIARLLREMIARGAESSS